MISDFKDKIYFCSPVSLQNVMVSVYGFSLRRRRYAKAAKEYFGTLLENETKNSEELFLLQQALFIETARNAILHVPFYREWAAAQHIKVEDIRSLDDLHLFPILDKETVRKRTPDFYDERYVGRKGVFFLSTSGTTGTPLRLLVDSISRTRHYAFWSRIRSWFGLPCIPRRATFFGRIIMLPEKDEPPFWRYDIAQKNLLFSSYHLREKNLKFYVEKLERFHPDEVVGYPSSLYQLALYIDSENLEGAIRPKVVFTTAENLLPYQREKIVSAFQCPLINQYGCTEMAMFASECEFGRLHLHPEHGFIEVLPDGDKGSNVNVPSGKERGEIVCTGFVNSAMPLLRYRLGDRIVLSQGGGCPCGRSFPVVDEIEGRIDDVIITPEGHPVGRLDPVFKGLTGIKECQIVQEEPRVVVVNIVCDANYNDLIEKELLNEFRKRLGKSMKIHIVKMAEIPRGAGGKFRPVVSKIFREQ